jgi:hypothetical protein
MFCDATAFNQPIGGWIMRGTTVYQMLAGADAFQQLLSGWLVCDVDCPFQNLGDNRIRVAGMDLEWHPSHRGRPIDQWLCAHDMVVLLRRSIHQTVLWRKLPEELVCLVGHWLGLNILHCNT